MTAIPKLTESVLGGAQLGRLNSRSLRLTRFSEPDSKGEKRKAFFNRAFQISRVDNFECNPLDRWLGWLHDQLRIEDSELVYGRLLSRLALHLSGGVMENASILLDRYGFPYIPGSGVKGLARRAAVYALRTWCSALGRRRPSEVEEPAAMLCAPFEFPEDMAVEILITFGWTDGEWRDGRVPQRNGRPGPLRSDLEWAFGEGQSWTDARPEIARRLAAAHKVEVKDDRPKYNYSGCSRFMDAHPLAAGYPKDHTDLELDVVACHHGEYYAGTGSDVPDTEDPVPVYFPTVAPGVTFVFAIVGPKSAFARSCLKMALSTFGAGAKTAAGYGWFDVSDATHLSALAEIEQRRIEVRDLISRRKAREAEAAKAEAGRKRKEKLAAERLALRDAIDSVNTPGGKEDLAVAALGDQQFETKLQGWMKLDDAEKRPLLRALSGSRRTLWDRITGRAEKKGLWRKVVECIRNDARRHNITLT